jgi:hypothetical protein
MDGMTSYLLGSLVLLAVAAGVAFALKRLWSLDGLPDLARLQDSPEQKYAMMGRLLSSRDIEFLRSEQGYTEQIEAQFRKQRAGVFKLYLESMQRDFDAIHAAARMMAAHGIGGAELSGQLVQLPLTFKRTLMAARWQVFLYGHGWATPSFTVQPAVEAMFKLRNHIDLSAATASA